ncbi:class I SAM-dependent methyltransferase [Polyangium sp. y55x31]|uniref:class I SAM-dependent methyltransferase n=1 Tax=Polyangium sp. y55x31 TaxID=3042688 RepID=UPI002482B34E|nr:class I SAM-dependent methyltransferase [Polyangium sp. y55x31]MDI1481188.1 class I SAM-dependent methyltransferase [Polyangium sp. y55x31]
MPLDLWPLSPPGRLIHEDRDLVAIDKPPFVPTHAPERSDDVHRRLTAHYEATQPGAPVYLGVHQRLERDASGVLVFTRRREANRSIAEQIERRRARRTYVALVRGTPGMLGRGKGPDRGVLRHRLAPGEGGHRVLPPSARAGQPSTVLFRVLDRCGDRTLLALTPEVGCPVDLPAQLGAEQAPIVGDVARGGDPAPRLALHLEELVLEHPADGRSLTLRAPIPAFFSDFLEGKDGLSDVDAIERRLREAAERRAWIARLPDTDAFRLANAAGDGLPGVTVDRYGDFLVISLYDENAEAARERILDAAFRLGATGIYLKIRPKHASRIVDAREPQFAPKDPVRGAPAPDPMIVHELGLPYEVRLGDGLSTGIFLDQRENRRRVREMASGLSVANLFAYTCPFTVAAAAGGARRTVSVDVSRGALEWARRNLDRIGADPAAHVLVEADAIKWLEKSAAKEGPFDLVILDPPSFATTKQTRFSAESDYKKLAASVLRVLAPGGRLLACTNHKGIPRAKFKRVLQDAARDAGRGAAQVKDWPDPEDFPPEPGGEAHLKTVLVTLERG